MPDRPRRSWRNAGRMSLRVRLVLAAAGAVAIATVLVAAGAYVLMRTELYRQTDASLRSDAATLGRRAIVPGERLGFAFQVIDADGNVIFGSGQLPVTADDRSIAAGSRNDVFHDATVGGGHYRVYTYQVGVNGAPGAAQLAVPLDAVDHTLSHLAVWLTLLGLGGIALASVLGLVVARAALAPVDRLTADAERVAATMDLSSSIEVEGADEIARLAQALNTLLATVDQSQAAQRRLVADASHELRTPLTSMRTNLELLARSSEIPADERQVILNDLVAQAAELTTLVNQLVDLEREPIDAEPMVECEFDEVVEAALARAHLHSPTVEFVSHLEPTTILGQPGVLERAVANLLDNAAKWSPPGETVEVNLVGGTLSVRDHGPGIDPADAPHVFERFYRSARARSLPGSGLGLSIVRQAAERHGGQAWVLAAPGGGTIACLRIPTVTAQPTVVRRHGPPAEGPPPSEDAAPSEDRSSGEDVGPRPAELSPPNGTSGPAESDLPARATPAGDAPVGPEGARPSPAGPGNGRGAEVSSARPPGH